MKIPGESPLRLMADDNSSEQVNNHQKGQVLVGVLITMVFFMSLVAAVSEYSVGHFSSTKRTLVALDALAVAEAGAESFLYNINQNGAYSGTAETDLYTNDAVKGRGTFESSAVNGSVANEKVVTVTGRVYIPYNASAPKVTRKVKLIIHSTNPTPPTLPGVFNLPMDVLSGNDNDSLKINNGASINNGQVHSNGGIVMTNLASIGTGTIAVPVTVSNFHAIANPITIVNAHIYGDVRANQQSTGSSNMTNNGLIANSGVAPVAFPVYDRVSQIAAASPPVSGATASCNNSSATWPANYHVAGNVTITNCTVTVTGNVWIEGKLTLSNVSIIQVAASASTLPVLMVDGNGGGVVVTNTSAFTQNASGYGFIIASYDNSISSIVFNNQSNAVGSILYSPGGTITLNNNSGMGIRAVFGNRILMNNSFQLTLGSPANLIWSVGYYQQDFS